MKRSKTVGIALSVFGVWILGAVVGIIPSDIDQGSGYWISFGLLAFAAMIRLFILFWQTLSHAVRFEPASARMRWVVYHLLLGPIASLWYYFSSRPIPPKPIVGIPPKVRIPR